MIYLDHAASAPLLPEAREAMMPWLDAAGNPSSLHAEGRRARHAIDEARAALAGIAGCHFGEFLFTSSGTESANAALLGIALASQRKRFIISAAEHHCMVHCAPMLERLGCKVDWLPVDDSARPCMDALADLLDDDVAVVAALHANNEIGTITETQPVREMTWNVGAAFICDAVQTFPSAELPEADIAVLSAHKHGGPKGIGGLIVKGGTKIKPLIRGGGQERDQRAGTENLSGIVGYAAAAQASHDSAPERMASQEAARNAFRDSLPSDTLITASDGILPGHCHLRMPGCKADAMLVQLDQREVCASSGAACSAGSLEPSHVLLAMGWSEEEAQEGLRFTFGAKTTISEAKQAAGIVADCAAAVRA